MSNVFIFGNLVGSTLSGPISSTATTINVAAGTGISFPNPTTGQQFALRLFSANNSGYTEIVYVTAISGDALTVVRAQEGTAALSFLAGDSAKHVLTAATLENFLQPSDLVPYLPASALPLGQCCLSVASTTSLQLSPYAGNLLTIAGVNQTVPSGGVTISNSSLSASTTYNVYAYMSGTTMALELSTTAHATDATSGVEIKSGDRTRTLVGKIQTNTSSQFNNTTAFRGCINWFNRKSLPVGGGSATNTTNSSSYINMTGTIGCSFLAWGDDAFFAVVDGYGANDTVGGSAGVSLTLDGVQGFAADSGMQASVAGGYKSALISTASFLPSEGWHSLGYVGGTAGTGGMTVTMSIQSVIRG